MNPSLDIVIVNWNSGPQLGACLTSIAAASQGVALGKVVVVDNASTDRSAEATAASTLPLVLLRNETNRGFGAACNQGAALARSQFLLFLNPDTVLSADSLRAPLDFMHEPRNAAVGICGIQLVDDQGTVARSCARFPSATMILAKAFGLERVLPAPLARHAMTEWDHADSRPVDQVIGAFFLVRRSLFLDLGGFDERFFVYFEEVDFSYRAALAGAGSYYLASARAFHAGGGSSRRVLAQRLVYVVRSRLEYSLKHFPRRSVLVILLASLVVEPCTRTALALVRGSLGECRDVLRAYRQLWQMAPGLIGRALRGSPP